MDIVHRAKKLSVALHRATAMEIGLALGLSVAADSRVYKLRGGEREKWK